MEWTVAVSDYEQSLVRRRLRPDSLKTYRGGLRDFVRFLSARGCESPDDLDRGLIEGWQDDLLRRELAPSTCSVYGTSVRRFVDWAEDQDLVAPRLSRAIVPVKVL